MQAQRIVLSVDIDQVIASPTFWWKDTDDGHPEDFSGTAEVEFASTELASDDAAEDWAEAREALDKECERLYGKSPSWIYVKRIGRWVTFEAS